MTTFMASNAERIRQKRQLADQAVRLAMQNQWQQAADVNRQILELAPDEAEAWNRLGKAFSELGRYAEAHDAYTDALKRDPNNAIAHKQTRRLGLLIEESGAGQEGRDKLDPRMLIEETGKTGIFELVHPAAAGVLARVAAGDQVHLKGEGSSLRIEDNQNKVLGEVPPKAGLRLIELMKGGNRYVAGVTSVTDRHIRVLIREVYQATATEGRVSFPSRGGPLPPELRSTGRERSLRFDLEDTDLLGDESDDDADDETEETASDIEYYEEGQSASRG